MTTFSVLFTHDFLDAGLPVTPAADLFLFVINAANVTQAQEICRADALSGYGTTILAVFEGCPLLPGGLNRRGRESLYVNGGSAVHVHDLRASRELDVRKEDALV